MSEPVQSIIRRKIEEAFRPINVEVEDQSALHAGHAGSRPGGETHFHISIVSTAFDGMSRLARQRAVYALFAEELKDRVHALSLDLKTPKEAETSGFSG